MESSTECQHILEVVNTPHDNIIIYKDECCYCFSTPKYEEGLFVCLTCFCGFCREHAELHLKKTQHPIYAQMRFVPKEDRDGEAMIRDSAGTEKPVTVGLGVPGGFDAGKFLKFDTEVSLQCLSCAQSHSKTSFILNSNDYPVLDSYLHLVVDSRSASQLEDIKAWELKAKPCEHTYSDVFCPIPIYQTTGAPKICSQCPINENLWMCLTCGFVGCSRENYDGSGGKGHAFAHYKETNHPLSVKLGTITPEGIGDVNCYICDDIVLDKKLSLRLEKLGIDVRTCRKYATTQAELEINQNMALNFQTSFSGGKDLRRVGGFGAKGFKNLGNTCYLNSTLQVLMSNRLFRERYTKTAQYHILNCGGVPAECEDCQLSKLVIGLFGIDGGVQRNHEMIEKAAAHAHQILVEKEHEEETHTQTLGGDERSDFELFVSPRMFKSVFCKNHPDFSGVEQQDAYDFLLYILDCLHRLEKERQEQNSDSQPSASTGQSSVSTDPTQVFTFKTGRTITCLGCGYSRRTEEEVKSLQTSFVLSENEIENAVQEQLDRDRDAVQRAAELKAKREGLPAPIPMHNTIPSQTPEQPQQLYSFEKLLRTVLSEEVIDLTCERCQHGQARVTSSLTSTPQTLVIQINRTIFHRYMPRKLEIPVEVPLGEIDLSSFVTRGTEGIQVETEGTAQDTQLIESLVEFGFPKVRADHAAAAGMKSVDEAIQWLLEHEDDPTIDIPLSVKNESDANQGFADKDNMINLLVEMGFTRIQAVNAVNKKGTDLDECVAWIISNLEESFAPVDQTQITKAKKLAVPKELVLDYTALHEQSQHNLPKYKLAGFVVHRGLSVHSGHYIAFTREGLNNADGSNQDEWLVWNDEKVAIAKEIPLDQAYVLFFNQI
ncbi:putative Ubiquitin carboxyl-terminal hydrolase 14 [Blattamonas nauphoetae]|uniref:Ubiquitin carboxyl-terminal hydrolase n=1 Tax=Blattamonas nauphoetae TaxID=2049346 RepID=A0ABQ9YF75_9EUKA|nr:putative Ubiquitin carboxyl-terminal hydrolase 14 [Blattamonas nauphoetae]